MKIRKEERNVNTHTTVDTTDFFLYTTVLGRSDLQHRGAVEVLTSCVLVT